MVGLINGFFTAVIGINSFITTLGMLLGLSGFTLIISDAQPVPRPGTDVLGEAVHVREDLRRRHLLGADLGARDRRRAAAPADADALGDLHGRGRQQPPRRRRGRHQRPPGDHPQLHPLQRSAPAWSACWRRSATDSVQPDPPARTSRCSAASSAAVIGGTLLAGGSGTVVGALIGALLLGVLNDGLIIKGVNADYLTSILGLAIIIAMAANTYVGRVRKGSGVA